MSRTIRYSDKACATCGKSFTPINPKEKYCSERCRHGVGHCKNCGNEFIKKSSTTGDFCSLRCWYKWDGRKQKKNCEWCGKEFLVSRTREMGQRFCGVECAASAKRQPRQTANCEFCGKPMLKNVRPDARYCSHSCSAKAHGGRTKLPDGSRRKSTVGYVEVKINGKWMLEHRYVMEKTLGRPLLSKENVHHRNGDKTDNSPENLELWLHKQPYGQRVSDLINELEGQPEMIHLPEGQKQGILAAIRRVFRLK